MALTNQYRNEMFDEFENNLLKKWYPLVIDEEYGGYYSNLSFDWQIEKQQDKMIVTQARHIWLLSKAADLFQDDKYKLMAEHGFRFLKKFMWDNEFGGFFQIRSREGKFTKCEKWFNEKRVYGNAFAIYGLAALYKTTKNEEVLELAKDAFFWIEKHSHDDKNKGYFQFLTREGNPFNKFSDYKTSASDFKEAGYKDQNSSIHLLEAFTELYTVWTNPLLKERLTELLFLIRDTITTEQGYLNLFFEDDWAHVSFKNATELDRQANFGLDHVSFGHDYETAFLMLEASHILGIGNDLKTLSTCKKMLDHSIQYGWDNNNSGFFDEGYYFKGNIKCTIIKDTKTWWPQAEGLNALLMFSSIFPDNNIYNNLFEKLWDYVKVYLIDTKNKGWYWGSLEKEAFMITQPKGSIWKAAYHDGRSLINCISMLSKNEVTDGLPSGFEDKIIETKIFLNHWMNTSNNFNKSV